MTWLDTLLLIVVVLALVNIDLRLRGGAVHIIQTGDLLRTFIERQDEANELLREIARDTDRMPKVETSDYRDDYPA